MLRKVTPHDGSAEGRICHNFFRVSDLREIRKCGTEFAYTPSAVAPLSRRSGKGLRRGARGAAKHRPVRVVGSSRHERPGGKKRPASRTDPVPRSGPQRAGLRHLLRWERRAADVGPRIQPRRDPQLPDGPATLGCGQTSTTLFRPGCPAGDTAYEWLVDRVPSRRPGKAGAEQAYCPSSGGPLDGSPSQESGGVPDPAGVPGFRCGPRHRGPVSRTHIRNRVCPDRGSGRLLKIGCRSIPV